MMEKKMFFDVRQRSIVVGYLFPGLIHPE